MGKKMKSENLQTIVVATPEMICERLDILLD